MKKIELITLTLNELQRSATMVSDVYMDAVRSNTQEENDTFKQIASDCDDALEVLRLKLRDTLEFIGNFQNNSGMICPVDMALSEVPFDLIYERKDEYDYEDENNANTEQICYKSGELCEHGCTGLCKESY